MTKDKTNSIAILAFGDFRAANCDKIRFADDLKEHLGESDENVCNF